jgi:ribosomal protein L32
MSVVGIKLNGVEMCRNCGDCKKQHTLTIDDAIDAIEDTLIV